MWDTLGNVRADVVDVVTGSFFAQVQDLLVLGFLFFGFFLVTELNVSWELVHKINDKEEGEETDDGLNKGDSTTNFGGNVVDGPVYIWGHRFCPVDLH